jgi:hypothetical protein
MLSTKATKIWLWGIPTPSSRATSTAYSATSTPSRDPETIYWDWAMLSSDNETTSLDLSTQARARTTISRETTMYGWATQLS